jgi:hypothetical protein
VLYGNRGLRVLYCNRCLRVLCGNHRRNIHVAQVKVCRSMRCMSTADRADIVIRT